ncbi:polyadenylate-binding protein-like [Topomyia yanbarensis]|uniref:polyadenylate-binding protein-like n=1 Tax=Topomyia yanbarensis TaxID=2498891 RepID=UPI00273C19EC|nr:polyadenylate-binding protein-like [Topomyia yanbarensis]
MRSSNEDKIRNTGKAGVFLRNIEKNIDRKTLYDICSASGDIENMNIVEDDKGNSKGYGYIIFKNQNEADNCVQRLDGILLNGKNMTVERFDQYAKFPTVYVTNYGSELDELSLEKMFEKYGTIISVDVISAKNGKGVGFGTVSFLDPNSAAGAARALNKKKLNNGMLLQVSCIQQAGDPEKELALRTANLKIKSSSIKADCNLYIKDMDRSVDENWLHQTFSRYGDITSLKIISKNSKRYGFVCFSTMEAASEAVAEINGRMVGLRPIHVAFADGRKNPRTPAHIQLVDAATSMDVHTTGTANKVEIGQAASSAP